MRPVILKKSVPPDPNDLELEGKKCMNDKRKIRVIVKKKGRGRLVYFQFIRLWYPENDAAEKKHGFEGKIEKQEKKFPIKDKPS